MDMQQIIGDLFDSALRVEKLIHIGTMCMDDSWPDIASESFEEDFNDVWAAMGISEPDESCESEWSEALRDARKLGFLVQFATPVPDRFYDGGSYSFSWAFYTLHWIYDDSLESACVRALEWKEEFIEKKRANALKTNPLSLGGGA